MSANPVITIRMEQDLINKLDSILDQLKEDPVYYNYNRTDLILLCIKSWIKNYESEVLKSR